MFGGGNFKTGEHFGVSWLLLSLLSTPIVIDGKVEQKDEKYAVWQGNVRSKFKVSDKAGSKAVPVRLVPLKRNLRY